MIPPESSQEQLLQELEALRYRVAELEAENQQLRTRQDAAPLLSCDPELNAILEQRTAALIDSNDQLVAEVVERRQAENALRAAKDQLQAILEAVPGMVSWISSDLRYLGVNRHLARIFGLEPEDFVNQDIGFLDTGSDFKDFVTQLFKNPAQDAFQEVYSVVNGVERNYLIVAQKYDNDRAAFVVGIDITQRKQAENNLIAAKDQLQAILEAVPGMVSWISSDLRYLGVNRHLANTFGLSPQDFVNQDIGFLDSSLEFQDFVRQFFASPVKESVQEITTKVKGYDHHYLIVSQKYDQDRAAFVIGIDITQRKQAEEALRQAEAKYRSIVENAIEGIFQCTHDGYYLSVNPALARIYGYDSTEALMTNLRHSNRSLYVHPGCAADLQRLLAENKEVVGFEAQIYRFDRSITWVSQNIRTVTDEMGNIIYYEGTVEDISERKQAQETLERINEELEVRVQERTLELRESNWLLGIEIKNRERIEEALRTSEAELRALFAAMTDIITVFDAEGRYAKIVNTNSEILYNPPSDRVGKSVYETLPPEQAELFFSNIQQVLSTGQTVNVEYNLPLANQDIWFAASISPLPNNSVIWVARNITERKRMVDALQKAEAKYRSIFENIAEGIFQSRPDGRLLSVNPALVKMFGYNSAEEMLTKLTNVNEIYVDPQNRQELIAMLEKQDSVFHFESMVYRQNESVIWISENVRAVRDGEGNLLYYEGTVDDISKRKQAELCLRIEQAKSERLLLNILPRSIADRLKQEEKLIADRLNNVTILFADLVDFTVISSQTSPSELVGLLNQIFSSFDQLAHLYNLEKIKTIGDAYMVVGGLPQPQANHAHAIADMALAMQSQISQFTHHHGEPFRLRIGINTGSVVAGVIGIKKFSYDLWGDAVNVASRMESQGEPGKIQVTEATYQLLKDYYQFEKRGQIVVKGRGEITSYWLLGK